jgi:NAD+ kinase
MNLGFVLKLNHSPAVEFAFELFQHLFQEFPDLTLFFSDSDHYAFFSQKGFPVKLCFSSDDLIRQCRALVVIGGDGTLLRAAGYMHQSSIPIIGINMGRLGFLTEIHQNEAMDVLRDFLSGKPAFYQERSFLSVALERKKERIFSSLALNEAVISKGEIARLIDLQLSIDRLFVTHIRADGLIVSSPTGSTAYSLAAGGPLIEPNVACIALTPINPHTLSLRPIIVNPHACIRIKLDSDSVFLTLDGKEVVRLEKNDEIFVQTFHDYRLQCVRFKERDYYRLLKEKLSFGVHA